MENFDFASAMKQHIDSEEAARRRQMRLFNEGRQLGSEEYSKLKEILMNKVSEAPNCTIREKGTQLFVSLPKSLHLTCDFYPNRDEAYLFFNIFGGYLNQDFMVQEPERFGLEKRYHLEINSEDNIGWVDITSKTDFRTSEELVNNWLKAFFDKFSTRK